jgi:hypothetical protein
MKILNKWSSTFEKQSEAPMAWPVVINIPAGPDGVPGEVIHLKSIQESISRTIGPDLMAHVSGLDPSLIVHVGKDAIPESDEDVSPPDLVPVDPTVNLPPEPTTTAPPAPEQVPVSSFPEKSRIKFLIVTPTQPKGVKMAVSTECTMDRLIRKIIEATGMRETVFSMELQYEGKPLTPPDSKLGECLRDVSSSSDRLTLQLLEKASRTPAKPRRVASTSPGSKKRRSNSDTDEISSAQKKEFEYWQSGKKSRDEEYEDDDLAMAIALSLSEDIK